MGVDLPLRAAMTSVRIRSTGQEDARLVGFTQRTSVRAVSVPSDSLIGAERSQREGTNR